VAIASYNSDIFPIPDGEVAAPLHPTQPKPYSIPNPFNQWVDNTATSAEKAVAGAVNNLNPFGAIGHWLSQNWIILAAIVALVAFAVIVKA
jgi:hypothetical protein